MRQDATAQRKSQQTSQRARRMLRQQLASCELMENGHQDVSPLDDPTKRPVRGRPGRLERVPTVRPGRQPKGQLEIWGEVIVKNGDTEFRARNKIVGQGLRHLINLPMGGCTGNGNIFTYNPFATNDLARSYIRVGTGTGGTTDGTTALLTPVATNPNSTLLTYDNPVAGQYRAKFTATWTAGTLTAVTVSEIGIFGNIVPTLGTQAAMNFGGTGTPTNGGAAALLLFARLSAADGEFTAFTVNTAVPLTIEYRVVYTFT